MGATMGRDRPRTRVTIVPITGRTTGLNTTTIIINNNTTSLDKSITTFRTKVLTNCQDRTTLESQWPIK